MADAVIWRMCIGDASRGCEFELDSEIAVFDGPETRQKKKMKMERRLYSYVLIFTHGKEPAVNYLILEPNEILEFETLCLTYDGPKKTCGRFTLRRRGDRVSLTLMCDGKQYTTLLAQEGIERLLASLRVKDNLDRYARTRVSSPENNTVRAKDLNTAATHIVAKYAVDYMDGHDSVFPKLMSQSHYRSLAQLFCNKELKNAFKLDCATISQYVQEATGITWQCQPRFLDFFLSHIGHAYNPYNEPLADMTADHLLVLGIWMLRMS